MPIAAGSNVPASSSLLNVISTPSPGRQGDCQHRTRVTRSGAYVRIEKRCSSADTAGPSADGMPAANVTSIACVGGERLDRGERDEATLDGPGDGGLGRVVGGDLVGGGQPHGTRCRRRR